MARYVFLLVNSQLQMFGRASYMSKNVYFCNGVLSALWLQDLTEYGRPNNSKISVLLTIFTMKKTVLFLAVAVLLGAGLSSCDRENNGGNNGSTPSPLGWVDLGLPSGLLWASQNLGADSPNDYGDYYAWGETSPKEAYGWETYAYGYDWDMLTKYCGSYSHGWNGFTDTLTTLEDSDDAARVILGDGARTPSYNDWQELLDNTTRKWTTRNGVRGLLLTGPNGNILFLPAAGGSSGTIVSYTGEIGRYWSDSLYTYYPASAWAFSFDAHDRSINDFDRCCGFSVRAVRDRQD